MTRLWLLLLWVGAVAFAVYATFGAAGTLGHIGHLLGGI